MKGAEDEKLTNGKARFLCVLYACKKGKAYFQPYLRQQPLAMMVSGSWRWLLLPK